MRSYYDLMEKSTELASDGSAYPDVMTLETNEFKFVSVPEEHVITSNDILRSDILVALKYGFSDYYDIVLDINEIGYMKDMDVGDVLYFPNQKELDDFYLRYH